MDSTHLLGMCSERGLGFSANNHPYRGSVSWLTSNNTHTHTNRMLNSNEYKGDTIASG